MVASQYKVKCISFSYHIVFHYIIGNHIIIVVGAIDIIWSTTTWMRGLISQYINYDVLNQYHHFLYLLVSS